MRESERLERYKKYTYCHDSGDPDIQKEDQDFSNRIRMFLNHPEIDEDCIVDASYYDFCGIPKEIQEKLNLWRDVYLIFGVTTKGEMISKWIDRWDLDSQDPIVDGICSHPERSGEITAPSINFSFNPLMLTAPMPELIIKMFGKDGNE